MRRSVDTNSDGGYRQPTVSAKRAVSTGKPLAEIMERDRLGQWTYSDGNKGSMSTNLIRGLDQMRDPRLNKVSAHRCKQSADLLTHNITSPVSCSCRSINSFLTVLTVILCHHFTEFATKSNLFLEMFIINIRYLRHRYF